MLKQNNSKYEFSDLRDGGDGTDHRQRHHQAQNHGGFKSFGFPAEYDIERKFRETRLYQVAPISTNLILSYVGEHVLSMPRSY